MAWPGRRGYVGLWQIFKFNDIHGVLILGAVAWRGCERVTGNKESTKHGLMV